MGQLGDGCAHLAQLFRVLVKLFQNGESLLLGAVLQNPLDYSAAIWMRGKHKHLAKDQRCESLVKFRHSLLIECISLTQH